MRLFFASLALAMGVLTAGSAFAQYQPVILMCGDPPAPCSASNPVPTGGGGAASNVNVTQFGSSNVVTGTGTGGAGIPRVTVSNDSTLGLIAGSAIIGNVRIDQTTPGTTNGVNIDPSNASGIGIVPVVSASAEGSHVFCSAACNNWGLYVTTGAAAGFLMTFNATSAPADGAVTPVECVQVAATSSAALNFGPGPPDRYSTGMTAVYSTTGCFNKTISATAFFKARVSQ